MNRESLVSAVSKKTGLSKARVSMVLEGILWEIESAVSCGKAVRLRGFGTFRARYSPPRSFLAFDAEIPVNIPGRHVPVFLPGDGFRDMVKEGFSDGGENHRSGG